MKTLALPDANLAVTVIRRPRKSIGLRVTAEGVELIAHPRVSSETLQEILLTKRDWILKHHARLLEQRANADTDRRNVTIVGEPLPIVQVEGIRRIARRLPDRIEIAGAADGDALRDAVSRLLRREAALLFPARLARFVPVLKRQPGRLLLSSARSRWGSCSAAGAVRLNWRLIQAPLPVLDYVLAHELAHLVHMNHSPAFWEETARLCPDWRDRRRWLKDHGSGLFDFG
ncbi:M48 family metallopeptidase [Paludibacterium paludis]|uniref:YgjP-like metallopeptidase domain-containing protein n=1 Tax=Paludibacterium paludis TaxID=1225769 RepID=A0A918P5D6_9NEIS|nr:SprT family zinc-dependent metalloprotease [Paludibacterium paludis]GGY21618.1 hypothetical protein GCM10011289_26580 [Paludibacterium paludis]